MEKNDFQLQYVKSTTNLCVCNLLFVFDLWLSAASSVALMRLSNSLAGRLPPNRGQNGLMISSYSVFQYHKYVYVEI